MIRPSRYDRAELPDLIAELNSRVNLVFWSTVGAVGVFAFMAWLFWTLVVNW